VAASSSAEESERMYSGISSVPKISSGSRSRLKSKKDESRDCNENQEKGMRRQDYSRMVRFWKRRMRGSEMIEVCSNGYAEHRRGYFISSGSASGVMTG
jgi:hypothetical protein